MLCRELSSLNWSGFVVLRCLGSSCLHAHCYLGISKFWTISDWTEFRLLRPSWNSLMSAAMSFALFSFLSAWHVYGFYTRGNHCDLFCSHVKGCACIDSWMWVFCMFASVCIISFLSETWKCDWLHITCQDVRHASWGNSECGLYRKCGSSVEVCGTHLRMRRNEFVFLLNGWFVISDCAGNANWNAKLGCRVCPSCILARVSPNGYIKLSLDVLKVLWRVHRCQLLSFLSPRIRQSLDMERLWKLDLLQDPNRAIRPCLTKRKVASRLWTGQARKKIDPVRPGWGFQSRSLPTQQISCHLAPPLPSVLPQWLGRWRVPARSWRYSSTTLKRSNMIYAAAWRPLAPQWRIWAERWSHWRPESATTQEESVLFAASIRSWGNI